jgi:proline dehydrogenase
MLRNLLIYFSKADWMKKIIVKWSVARREVFRFVAGDTLEEAIQVVRGLNDAGLIATLDQLGEETESEENARHTGKDIIKILDAIHESGVKSNLSLKLNQIGLSLDIDLCAEILESILSHAKKVNNFVRIDMEDSSCVDPTIEIYDQMRTKGLDNVGMVMQSYLYRAEEDTKNLIAQGCTIRVVKGAYNEPADIAYPDKKDTDKNYDVLMELLIDEALKEGSAAPSDDGKLPALPAAGTHDNDRIIAAKEYAAKVGLPKDKLEIQMLYGIRRELQESLAKEGYPVRIYVPFGTEWYSYFLRRLAERTANIWFFLSNRFKK